MHLNTSGRGPAASAGKIMAKILTGIFPRGGVMQREYRKVVMYTELY